MARNRIRYRVNATVNTMPPHRALPKICLLLTLLGQSAAQACLRDTDCSPPGLSLTYWQMGEVTAVQQYDASQSWYTTKSASYLLPTFQIAGENKLISISTWEKWYCKRGMPDYCAPLAGLNGKLLSEPTGHIWPKPAN